MRRAPSSTRRRDSSRGSVCVRALRLAWLLGAAAPCAGAAAAGLPGSAENDTRAVPAVSIELRPHVRVAEGQVRLGDVANLTTRDLALLRTLMALPLGAAPSVGSPVAVDRSTVARWVEARSGLRGTDAYMGEGSADVKWLGASEVEIERNAQEIPADRITQAAQSALIDWLKSRSSRAEVHVASTGRDLILPSGAVTLVVRPLPAQGQPQDRMTVWVDAGVDGRFARTTAVRFEVDAWGPRTLASAPLARGAALDPVVAAGGLTRREIELTTSAGRAALMPTSDSSSATTAPQRLRRPLREGEVLTAGHLEEMPAVVRGDSAQLVARSGDVSVESRVEVLQDGRKGQTVRVKVPGARSEVLARVVGPGQLEAQP